jgi:hypothetical protein
MTTRHGTARVDAQAQERAERIFSISGWTRKWPEKPRDHGQKGKGHRKRWTSIYFFFKKKQTPSMSIPSSAKQQASKRQVGDAARLASNHRRFSVLAFLVFNSPAYSNSTSCPADPDGSKHSSLISCTPGRHLMHPPLAYPCAHMRRDSQ